MKTFNSSKKPLILIVDDNPKNIQLVGNILRQNVDCDFSFASNGFLALDAVEKNPPDLILLDVMMPELNGFETCKRLKNNERFCDIPVIFLTARIESEDIVEGFEHGAVDYIPKPFVPSELLSRVKTQLKIKEHSDIIQKQNDERKQLLHVLCHDLSNPFSSLISCMELISDADMFMSFRDDLISLANNGLNIIELIRRMRSLDEKGLQLDPYPVNLWKMIQKSLVILKPRIETKKINIDIDIPPEITVLVESISFVNSVVNNLLSNAIKFSKEGDKIEISATQNDREISLKIRDYGIGMPESICANLFDIRKATSRPGTNGEPGTGFGMPLVKKFVESYNGRLSVSSAEEKTSPDNHGTLVELQLPNPSGITVADT